MKRIPEPQLMVTREQCTAFANSERGYIRSLFVESLLDKIDLNCSILNLGAGPCDYDIEIVKQVPGARIVSVDASPIMCDIANSAIKDYPITVVCKLFEDIDYDADVTISSLTLHHQLDPLEFWNIIKNNTKKNGYIFVMDMLRPNNLSDIETIVTRLAGNEDFFFINDFKNSLAASYTLEEIQDQLTHVGLSLKIDVVGSSGTVVLIYGENK
jgi:trans-aconitate 2-methyltransferase